MKFSILAIRQEDDGSMSADVDFDDEMAEQIRSHYGVQDITPDLLTKVVGELLEQYIAQASEEMESETINSEVVPESE